MSWVTWLPRLLYFALWYARELLMSNLAVVLDNLTPGQNSTPGIAELPTRCRTDVEVTLLSALISLTPGTLTLGVSMTADPDAPATRTIYVHGMYAAGADALRTELRVMERHLLSAWRREGLAS